MNSATSQQIQAVKARIAAIPADRMSTDCASYTLACKSYYEAKGWAASDDIYADQRTEGSLCLADGYLRRIEGA